MTTDTSRKLAARLHDHGKPLVLEDVDPPVPAGDEVVIEMAFAGVNPIDRYIAEGRVAPDSPLPRTMGMEGAGRLADDGQAVLVHGAGLAMKRDGAWAQRVVAPRGAVTAIPEGVDLAQAAAMGVAGVTA
ncbi:MAG TPA: zinc-binding alcohol dehydrogenase family protein, partial [Acidimicrobiia bacterium]|nr:zinc-binding alcohol dehydrogenase family protein [Acidimicrobiia bacterium]